MVSVDMMVVRIVPPVSPDSTMLPTVTMARLICPLMGALTSVKSRLSLATSRLAAALFTIAAASERSPAIFSKSSWLIALDAARASARF